MKKFSELCETYGIAAIAAIGVVGIVVQMVFIVKSYVAFIG